MPIKSPSSTNTNVLIVFNCIYYKCVKFLALLFMSIFLCMFKRKERKTRMNECFLKELLILVIVYQQCLLGTEGFLCFFEIDVNFVWL